jgi:ribosome-associated protein
MTLTITPQIQLAESDLSFSFIRAGGPGGQNVNKVSSAVQLRFNVRTCPNLPEPVRRRLLTQLNPRLTSQGELIIEARRQRTQEQNRRDAIERLAALIRAAARPPRPRRPTRPSRKAKQRRLEAKTRRSRLKQQRRRVSDREA